MPEIRAFGSDGNTKLTSFLGEVAKRLDEEAQKRTYAAANVVRRRWVQLLSGPRTGRVYRRPGSKAKRAKGVFKAKRRPGMKGMSPTAVGASYLLGANAGHYVASAPGEAPASVLHDFRLSVKAVSKRSSLFGEWEALVGSDMEKAPWLEYGTGRAGAAAGQGDLPAGYTHGSKSGMAPRPSLRPALEQTRQDVRGILGRKVI